MNTSHSIHQQAQIEKLPNPKSGQLSADRVSAKAWRLLSQSPYTELRRVNCEETRGLLVLNGQVSSFYLKQLAQEIVRQVDGVEAIANELEVRGKSL